MNAGIHAVALYKVRVHLTIFFGDYSKEELTNY